MDLIEEIRVMPAIYWEATTKDQNGQFQYKLPEDFMCRWEDEATRETDAEGNEIVYTSTVYVDRVMKNGDRIMLGKKENLKGALPPPSAAKQIRKFDALPDFDAEEYLYTAYL